MKETKRGHQTHLATVSKFRVGLTLCGRTIEVEGKEPMPVVGQNATCGHCQRTASRILSKVGRAKATRRILATRA